VTGGTAPAAAVAYLRTPEAIRERAGAVLARGLEGGLSHFRVDLAALAGAADLVARITRERFPDLRVPLHSRWRHFSAGARDRVAELSRALAGRGADDRVRAKIDLVVTSVLLDAGAGAAWRYAEAGGGEYPRSEGLAVASFRLFAEGGLSGEPAEPWRADAKGLEGLSEDRLARAFQVSARNPLPGIEGRAALLRRLGPALRAAPDLFGPGEEARPGHLLDALRARSAGGGVEAADVLGAVLRGFGPIWPGRLELHGVNLGDVWRHPAAIGPGPAPGLLPLHKLSQWLTYSLIEPLGEGGLAVAGLERLTGLAEYRNGGLFVDTGVLEPRHAAVTRDLHQPGDEVVVEWRALTVALLDRLAALARERLGDGGRRLPLASILEGGTWYAGRRLAEERRGGAPPIRVESDGTVM